MPLPNVPPATPPPVTPNQPVLEQVNNNDVNPQQEQNQFVTPGVTNTESNQQQNSTGTGTGLANVQNSPVITGQSTNVNSQVNTGYGENSEECMANVGCRDVPSIDFAAYYGNNSLNNRVDGLTNAYGSSNSVGAAIRLVIPLGNGFRGNLDKVAEEELARRVAETKLLQQRLIAESIALDEQVIKSCVNLKNTVNGKSISITRENASPVVARAHDMCEGLDVIIASAPPTEPNDLAAENAFLRQKIEQLTRQNVIQKVGN